MKWLYIIDPLENLNPDTDTTYPVMVESQKRGIETHFASLADLYFSSEARVNSHQIHFDQKQYFIGNKENLALDEFEIIHMRKEPPYDLSFHYATCLLSLTRATVVNRPQALRDQNEKLIILNFPNDIPRTMVSSKIDEIIDFVRSVGGDGIVKSLDTYQGKSVFRLSGGESEARERLMNLTESGKMPVMVQEFLPQILEEGDKRVIVLGDRVLGAVGRIPKKGDYHSNFSLGGTPQKTTLTAKEEELMSRLIPFFQKQGIHFAGLDVVNELLTEVNITCPTGIQQINRLENRKLEVEMVDYYESLRRK
jgi:glutathione synthase